MGLVFNMSVSKGLLLNVKYRMYKLFFLLSIILVPMLTIVFIIIYKINPQFYIDLTDEDNIVEWFTFILLFFAGIFSFIKAIKINNFNKIRELCSKLPDPGNIFSTIYEYIDEFEQSKRPVIIIIVAKYSAWNSQVRDRLVNAVACSVEVAGC